MQKLIVLFGLLALISTKANADFWKSPSITRYYSDNGRFMLKVIPTFIPDKYWDWKSSKTKKRIKFTAKDTVIIKCHAILYSIENKDTIEIWNKRLINDIAPVTAIISNNGKSVITFDNWSSMGYGLDVMVVYDSKGGLKKRYQLENFSPIPINDYFMSISSIWWRCGVKFIDENSIEICFQDDKKNVKTRKYNISTNEFE